MGRQAKGVTVGVVGDFGGCLSRRVHCSLLCAADYSDATGVRPAEKKVAGRGRVLGRKMREAGVSSLASFAPERIVQGRGSSMLQKSPGQIVFTAWLEPPAHGEIRVVSDVGAR